MASPLELLCSSCEHVGQAGVLNLRLRHPRLVSLSDNPRRASFRISKVIAFDNFTILRKHWLCKQCRRIGIKYSKLALVNEEISIRILRALGQRIRELRSAQGYSQEGFADKCGVHRTFMGTIERGESNLSFQNILKVATTLGISLSTLFLNLEGAAQSKVGEPSAPHPRSNCRTPAAKSAD